MLRFCGQLLLVGLAICQLMDPTTFQAYIDLVEIQQSLNTTDLGLPHLALLGVQSAGKSSFLETYVGFPLAHSSPDTGTRCPVKYTLVHDETLTRVVVKVAGVAVEQQKLCDTIKQHMMSLKEQPIAFSLTPLEVEIRSPDLPNIVFTDLPGARPSVDAEEQQVVQRIIQYYARNPSYLLITILRATTGHDTLSDLGSLDTLMKEDLSAVRTQDGGTYPEPRPDWRKSSVMIINHINSILDDPAVFGDIAETKEWFNSHQRQGPRYFVALKTNSEFVREKKSYDEIAAMLSTFHDDESALFDAFKRKVITRSKPTDVWSEDTEQFWTVKRAQKAIAALWIRAVVESLPALVRHGEQKLSEAREEQERVQSQIDEVDPERFRETLQGYGLDFVDSIHSLITSTMIRTGRGRDIFNYQRSEDFTFCPSVHGKTFWEEFGNHEVAAMQRWNLLIPQSELCGPKHLKDHELGELLKHKLVGIASFKRLIKLVSYFMYNAHMVKNSNSDIYNMAFDENRSDMFAASKVVSQMTRAQLLQLEDGFKYIRSQLLGTSRSYAVIVHDFLLTTQYSNFREFPNFPALVYGMSDLYVELLENQLKAFGQRMRETIRMYSNYVRMDLPVRSWMMNLVHPMEDRILNKEIITATAPDHFSFESTLGFQFSNNGTSESLADGESKQTELTEDEESPEIELVDADIHGIAPTGNHSSPGVSIHPRLEIKESGQYGQQPARNTLKLRDRNEQKRIALIQLKTFFSANSRAFNLADVVEGGYVNLRPIEWGDTDFDYLRSVAYELYMHYVQWITLDIEMAMETYIIEHLKHEGMSWLRKKVQSYANEIKAENVLEIMGVDMDALETSRDAATQRVRLLEQLLSKAALARGKLVTAHS